MKLLIALLTLSLSLACVTEETRSGLRYTGLERSYGTVVSADLDTTWRAVTGTFTQLGGSAAIDAGNHTATTQYRGALVTVRAQRKGASNTILRVHATRDGQEDTGIAEQVLMSIQRRLIQF